MNLTLAQAEVVVLLEVYASSPTTANTGQCVLVVHLGDHDVERDFDVYSSPASESHTLPVELLDLPLQVQHALAVEFKQALV